MLKGCTVKSAGSEGAPDPPTSLQLPVWAALSRELFLPLGSDTEGGLPSGRKTCKHTASSLVPI